MVFTLDCSGCAPSDFHHTFLHWASSWVEISSPRTTFSLEVTSSDNQGFPSGITSSFLLHHPFSPYSSLTTRHFRITSTNRTTQLSSCSTRITHCPGATVIDVFNHLMIQRENKITKKKINDMRTGYLNFSCFFFLIQYPVAATAGESHKKLQEKAAEPPSTRNPMPWLTILFQDRCHAVGNESDGEESLDLMAGGYV